MIKLFFIICIVTSCTPCTYADISVGTATRSAVHRSVGTRAIKRVSIGTNTTPVWQTVNPPTISRFSVSPVSINLDSRPTGTLTFNIGITGFRTFRGYEANSGLDIADLDKGTTSTRREWYSAFKTSSLFYFVNARSLNRLGFIAYNLSNRNYVSAKSSISTSGLNFSYVTGQGITYTWIIYVNPNGRSTHAIAYSSFISPNTQAPGSLNINFGVLDSRVGIVSIVSASNTNWFVRSTISSVNNRRSAIALAYNGGTNTPNTARNINLGSLSPSTSRWRGAFASSTIVWFMYYDSPNDRVVCRAYNASTLARLPNEDIFLSGEDWMDGVYYNNTIWFIRRRVDRAYAYTFRQSGQATTAQIYNVNTGLKVGPEYNATNGNDISTTVPNIPQPTENTTYSLTATNTGGNNHSDVSVTVSKGLLISNFRRTEFRQSQISGRAGGSYTFKFRITGYPVPNRFVFSGVHSFITDGRHLTPVPGQPNTWDFTITFNIGVNSGALVLVVTNGTADSATARIANIGV